MTVIPEEELIENIDKYFRTLVSDKRIFANEVLEHYKKHQPKSPTTALTAQLEKLRVLRKKQIAMFEGSIITITELKERTADIDKQIAQVELDLRQYESPEDAARKAKELYDRIEESIENYSTIGKMTNAELKTLIKSIVVDEKQNIRIELNY